MARNEKTLKEIVIEQVKATGILPCIKLHQKDDFLAYAKAMYDGGARVIEVTMTTPGALEAIEIISREYKNRLWVAAGTVLDAVSAREVILHGGSVIVNPALIPDVIDLANRYCVPVFSGAFTATEVLGAMRAGATMVKIFPAQLGGAKYMTNLKMVYPDVNLIPSGGISLDNAAEFIRCGACAVSGARTFMDREKIKTEGLQWITKQVGKYIEIITEAKKNLPELP
jgi:2-dehydro-3-deoxyphosphogluconate aldolase / (4S)-4-hydroxy-2-oxoglutarate aldolase